MVKKKKITWKAKGKDIATYRNMLNLTQGELVQKAVKKYKLKIGLRHLQNAEAGKEIGIDTLTNLAYFFDRESIDVAFEPDSVENCGILQHRKVSGIPYLVINREVSSHTLRHCWFPACPLFI